jgi:hypothetical protein
MTYVPPNIRGRLVFCTLVFVRWGAASTNTATSKACDVGCRLLHLPRPSVICYLFTAICQLLRHTTHFRLLI